MKKKKRMPEFSFFNEKSGISTFRDGKYFWKETKWLKFRFTLKSYRYYLLDMILIEISLFVLIFVRNARPRKKNIFLCQIQIIYTLNAFQHPKKTWHWILKYIHNFIIFGTLIFTESRFYGCILKHQQQNIQRFKDSL